MGHYVEWQGENADGEFWRGVKWARKKERERQRSKAAGKRELLRGVLRWIEIVIVAWAAFIILVASLS
jgi:hypothetical protein